MKRSTRSRPAENAERVRRARQSCGWRPSGSPPGTIPLGTWIEEEAAAAVRGGELAPGTRLPSVRRLADRVGVHRNTVRSAYRRLADRGLVRMVHGSGCFVRGRRPSGPSDGPELPVRSLLAAARERGATTADLADAFRRWERSLSSDRLLVAAPKRALGEVWARELVAGLQGLAVEVEVRLPEDLLAAPAPEAAVAAPPELLDDLSRALSPWVEIVPIVRSPGLDLRRQIGGLSQDALVLVVSDSAALRQRLVTLAGLADPPPVVAGLSPGETDRLRRVARVARLVVCDLVSARTADPWIGATRLAVFRDLAPGSIDEVRRRLSWSWPSRPEGCGTGVAPEDARPNSNCASNRDREDGRMKIHLVTAEVPSDRRERYLRAWEEWSGTLFAMEIRTELLESRESPGRFVELTWFEPGEEAALGDDRMVRANAELSAAAETREGDLAFYRRVEREQGA